MEPENVALFDMDGTLCDYNQGMLRALESLYGPNEDQISEEHFHSAPDYIRNRIELIRSRESFWTDLERFQLGWDVLPIAEELGFRTMILTQGPRNHPEALSGKLRWLHTHLPDIDFTLTRDKGLVYGRVLVDDYPKYIDRWLTWRKNGVVIMPAQEVNEDYSHPQVVRYDGSNLDEVRERMAGALH